MLIIITSLHIGCNRKSSQTNPDSTKENFINKTGEDPKSLSSLDNKNKTTQRLNHQLVNKGSKESASELIQTNVSEPYKFSDELLHAGINHQNINLFFHHSESYRALMREKLLNSRDPFHRHIVWQKLKEMLTKNTWKSDFDKTLSCLWENSEESFKIQILNHLLLYEKLIIIGRAPWTASQWLQKLEVPKKYDMHLLKALRISQHPARQWVRNYLSTKYKKNLGSNYLVWKRYLER